MSNFCMVGGTGVTSYANNSIFQKNIIGKMKPMLEESVRAVCHSNTSSKYLAIADLGCSSGPNALVVLQSIINVIASAARGSGSVIPELNVFLNDLPHNDFNAIFKMLSSFHKEIERENGIGVECYISGTPGSFYGRLFPRNLLHFMHSSTSLQWLSQTPKGLTGENGEEAMNKGCIYGRKGSPSEVIKAYREQFSDDFAMFLRCRSIEIVHDGRILLGFVVTHDDEACSLIELTSVALYKLASQGGIDKEKLDRFNLHYYRPTVDQVKQLIESEGSFSLDKLDIFTLSWVEIMRSEQVNQSSTDTAISITRSIRAITEILLASEFGEEIMNKVFHLVQGMVIDNIATGQDMPTLHLALSLTRRG